MPGLKLPFQVLPCWRLYQSWPVPFRPTSPVSAPDDTQFVGVRNVPPEQPNWHQSTVVGKSAGFWSSVPAQVMPAETVRPANTIQNFRFMDPPVQIVAVAASFRHPPYLKTGNGPFSDGIKCLSIPIPQR